MKSSLDFISSLDEDIIRDVHSGEYTRKELKEKSEEMGYSKNAGEKAHRLIRAHENLEAFIAFYVDGVSYSEKAFDSPEIKGNVADITIRYPHGRPVKGLEELLDDHGENPDDWEVESFTANEWPTTMGTKDDNVIYVNNYQAKAKLSKKTREPQYERVKPIKIDTPETPDVKPVNKSCPDDWKTALILMDRQTGHRRSHQDWTYETIHDRQAIDLAVQVSALAKPDILVDVGDLLDFAGVSNYVGTPDLQRSLQPALCETAYDNARLMSASEAEEFHVLEGNHDERINEKLIEDAQEMYQLKDVEAQKDNGPPAMSVPALLNFEEADITYHEGYPDNEFLLNDGVAIKHGDTVKSDSGGTARYELKYEISDYSVVFGHIHRHEVAWKTVWKGDKRRELFAGSGGCLCRVDGGVPGVKDRQNWQQGLIMVHYNPDGWEHMIKPIRIWPSHSEDGKSVCWFKDKKLIADPPSAEELSEKTGFNFV